MATVISSGTRTITSGNSLVDVNILSSGAVVVSNGGKLIDTFVYSGGKALVSSGGTISAARVIATGSIYVSRGGLLNDVNIYGTGYVRTDGGNVYSARIGDKCTLDLWGWSSGGSTVYGYASNVDIVSGGQLVLGYYALGSAVKVSSGYVFVSSGGFLQGADIGSGAGASKSAEVYIRANGSGHANYIYSNGIMVVSNGGSATSTRVHSGGSLVASSGGVLKSTSAFGGVVDVLPGGNATSTTISSNGGFYVSEGAIVSGTTITSGRMYLMSSATAYETILKAGTFTNYADSISGTFSGGTAYLSGGSSYHEKMLGGVMEVSSYGGRRGYATALDVSSATVYLNSDTSLNVGYVSGGGKLYVYEGARASSVNVYTGGEVFVKNGGYISGGSIYGSETIMSGGTAYGMNVLLLGTLDVRGRAYNCTVSSGGTVFVSSGGRFAADLLYAGARISAMSGGTAVVSQTSGASAVVSGGSVYVSGGSLNYAHVSGGQLYISSGAKVQDAFISAGTLAIQGGASASRALVVAGSDVTNLTVNSNGFLGSADVSGCSARLNIAYGASANTADVQLGASATIGGKVLVSCFVASGAKATVSSGGSVTNAMVTKDASMTVSSAGNASIVNVLSGGSLMVSYGGKASETVVGSEGEMTIYSGGSVVSGVTVTSGGWLRIASSGYADAIVLNKEGDLSMEGGTVMNLLVRKDCRARILGGTVVSATLATGGSAFCHKTGRLGGTVSSGGTAVFSGGMATGLTVINGGKVRIADNLNMLDGDAINFNAGGTLDFDISKITASSYAALLTGYNDHILYGGNAVYTLTVGDSQKNMTYSLASNASLFNSTITVQNTLGTSLGTLTLGGKTTIGDKDYTLNLGDDKVLSVSVAAAQLAGTAKSDIDGNGKSDVMFVWTGEHGEGNYQHGYWMNGTSTWQSANTSHPASWDNLGNYDMTGDGKADSVLFGNVDAYEVPSAYIGYYKDGIDTDENWVTIGFLTNAAGIAWKNAVGNVTGGSSNSIIWHAAELGALGAWTDGTDNWINLGGGFDSTWTLIGCGDFSGDGKDSVLMSHNGGEEYYGIDYYGTFTLLGASDSGWEVRAIGDFSGDGKDDIVAFHEGTGIVAKWADGQVANWSQLGQLDAKDWFVVGAGDYDGDAKDDLLVRQISTGMLGYYSAGDMSAWVEMGRGVDMQWTVIA